MLFTTPFLNFSTNTENEKTYYDGNFTVHNSKVTSYYLIEINMFNLVIYLKKFLKNHLFYIRLPLLNPDKRLRSSNPLVNFVSRCVDWTI